jgi:uncharacterized protein (DUF433 family)
MSIAHATAEHREGAVRLDGFPLLAYAPDQHGPGVRTEDKGVLVSEIVAASADQPDHAALAARFGTTADHVKQALAYALFNPLPE